MRGFRSPEGRPRLFLNQPHKAALERGQHVRELVAPLQYRAMLAHQSKRPLLQPKLGAFLYAHLGAFRMAPIGGEDRHVGADPYRIIAPVTRGDHSTVEVENPIEFAPVKGGDCAPVPT